MNIDLCRIIELPSFSDDRGNLTFIEQDRHIPFEIQRVYYLYDIPERAERGGHAHRVLEQLFVAVSGSLDVLLDDGGSERTFHLDSPRQGLYVCPMIWRELRSFSDRAVCLVLASHRYDESDYLRNYVDFTRMRVEA